MESRSNSQTDRAEIPTFINDVALFERAIECVADAVVVTAAVLDPPGPIIEYVNPAFTAMTGYTAGEVIGRSPRFLQGPETERATLDQLRAALMAGQPFMGEAINYRKNGHKFYVEWRIAAVHDKKGHVRHWIAVQRDVTERCQMQARQNALMAELQHRTRNLLAVVDAIARRTLHPGAGLSTYYERLAALSRTQDLLSSDETWSISLIELVQAELHAHGVEGSYQVRVAGPTVELPGEQAQPVGMVLHELATNALKYGALAQPAGQLRVTWDLRKSPQGNGSDLLHLLWHESGVVPQIATSVRKGFGRELIERTLPYQFEAETKFEFTPDGLRCLIIMPVTAGASHTDHHEL